MLSFKLSPYLRSDKWCPLRTSYGKEANYIMMSFTAIMLFNTEATHMHNVRNEHYSFNICSPYTRKHIVSGGGSNKTKINDLL